MIFAQLSLLVVSLHAAQLRLVDVPCGTALRLASLGPTLEADPVTQQLLTRTFAGQSLLGTVGAKDVATFFDRLRRLDEPVRERLVRERLELAAVEVRRGHLTDADRIKKRREQMRASVQEQTCAALSPLARFKSKCRAWWQKRPSAPAPVYHPDQIAEYYLNPRAIELDVAEVLHTRLGVSYPRQPMDLHPAELYPTELDPNYWYHAQVRLQAQDAEGPLRVGYSTRRFHVAFQERLGRIRLFINFSTARDRDCRLSVIESAIRHTQFTNGAARWRPYIHLTEQQIWILGLPKDERTRSFVTYLMGDVN